MVLPQLDSFRYTFQLTRKAIFDTFLRVVQLNRERTLKFAFTLCLLVSISLFASAQEMSVMRSSDSLSFRSLTFPEPGQQLLQPAVLLPLDFSDSTVTNNLPPGFLRTAMLHQPALEERIGQLSSLRLQTIHEDRWQILTTALGYIQARGTAYFTYRALKKYGYIR